jgi:hypothetical protein
MEEENEEENELSQGVEAALDDVELPGKRVDVSAVLCAGILHVPAHPVIRGEGGSSKMKAK